MARRAQLGTRYRVVCTVANCGWRGAVMRTEERALKDIRTHAMEAHASVQEVRVRRTVVTEVVEDT